MKDSKFFLTQDEIPRQWYNIAADLPTPMQPPVGPDGNPITPDMLAPVFPMNLIEQEVSTKRWIDIPEEVLSMLSIWRPSPLVRARRLEELLKTPARIYYKDESMSPPGSHKPNTAVAQAWYNKTTDDRDWGGAMGKRARVRLQSRRPRM
jgi:tryptophan synthase beta chain